MLLTSTINKLVIAKRIFKDKTSNKNIGSMEYDEKGLAPITLAAK
jgi:hypothetical protein